MVSEKLSAVLTHKSVRAVFVVAMLCFVAQATTPLATGSSSSAAERMGIHPATEVVGGFMNFTLSPACLRAVLVTAVACSQVGLAGLAGCGFLLYEVQASCL